MFFWPALAIAAKTDRLKQAETKLLSLAREFGNRNGYEYRITTMDTAIPRHVVPLQDNNNANADEDLILHAVKVQSLLTKQDDKNNGRKTEEIPLVLLHGYMNAAAYFYRNLVGLTHYFDTVYSLDLLGWGLSSRPNFVLKTTNDCDEISAAEDFFVQSLEAWRKRNNIPKMILAGHSMGGYLSVKYSEVYPQHVERMLLLSPVGVPEESEAIRERRAAMKQNSWRVWFLSGFAQNVFEFSSAGGLLRTMPISWGENMFTNYVQKRMPMIADPMEQKAVAEYLIANNTLPGSGEHCVNKLLTSNAYAKRPTEYRIPNLKVSHVSFLYGDHDWMDPKGGLLVQRKCQQQQCQEAKSSSCPKIDVYCIRKAGHLLMLENWKEFNAAVILGAGGTIEDLPNGSPIPTKLNPDNLVVEEDHQPVGWRRPPTLKDQSQRSSTSSLSASSDASSTTTEPQIAS